MGILCNAGDVQAGFLKRARKKVMKLMGFMSTIVSKNKVFLKWAINILTKKDC